MQMPSGCRLTMNHVCFSCFGAPIRMDGATSSMYVRTDQLNPSAFRLSHRTGILRSPSAVEHSRDSGHDQPAVEQIAVRYPGHVGRHTAGPVPGIVGLVGAVAADHPGGPATAAAWLSTPSMRSRCAFRSVSSRATSSTVG